MRDNLNKNDQDDFNENDVWLAGIRHERNNSKPGSMADIFLAELERQADPPRTLRERRATPPRSDSQSQEPDPPRSGPLTGP